MRYYVSEGGSVYSPLVSQLGSQHWFLFDALGTTLGLTDEAGSSSDTFKYEAFGTSLGRTGATATPYQYVGGYGYFDEAEVGVEQVWHRWLDLTMGRWYSPDPLRPSHHIYANANPAWFTDPTGMIDWGRMGTCAAEAACVSFLGAIACGFLDTVTMESCAIGCTLAIPLDPAVYLLCIETCHEGAQLAFNLCLYNVFAFAAADAAACLNTGCTPCLSGAIHTIEDIWRRLNGGGPAPPPRHYIDPPRPSRRSAYV